MYSFLKKSEIQGINEKQSVLHSPHKVINRQRIFYETNVPILSKFFLFLFLFLNRFHPLSPASGLLAKGKVHIMYIYILILSYQATASYCKCWKK